ncbi:MAG: hypothetical protein LQ337_006513 [Flavoplaca oasis]|nr:MAG: hypothetical protein LQ337_006513 [Flavoplaca oasis]
MADFRTVQLLQCRCPGLDKVDAKFVTEQMSQRNLFPSIDDVPTRTQIQESLLKVPCLIPSLSTFFEDTKWLEPVAKVIRRLLPPSCKESNRRALFRKYTGLNYKRGTVQIQRRNQKWDHLSGDETQHMECGYRQLCSFAWRHFPELIAIAPRKDKGKERPQIKATNKQSWRKLAQLARSLGFDSPEIANLAEHNPDLAMVITFLGQVRPQEFYSQSKNGSSVNEICRILEGIEEQSSAITVAEYLHADVPLEYRCGRPFEKAHESSRGGFFLLDLNSSFEGHLSHFVVQRDIFRAFFGSNFLPLFGHSQIQRENISNLIPREPEASSSQIPRFNPPSCEFTSSNELHRSFSRPTKAPGRRGPVRRMNTIDETVTQRQHSLDTTVQSSLSDKQHEGQLPQVQDSDMPDISTRNRDQATQQIEKQASERVNIDLQDQEQSSQEQTPEQCNIGSEVQESQEQASERVNINTQGERQVSPVSQEQIIEQSNNNVQPSPKQAGDRRQSYTQTEEPVSHETETRRELHDPAQPFTQTGDDEIEGLFNDDEAPHEKFTLPLGSQAEGLPSSNDEQRGNVLTGKEPDQEFLVWEYWRKWCHNGDWLLVSGQEGNAHHIPAKDQHILKDTIAKNADQYYYAYYDERKGRLATVVAEKVCDWGKSEKSDGVIYLFKKDHEPRRSELGNVGFDTFKGANTEIRLKLIHAMVERNRLKRPFSEYDPFGCLNESDEGRRKRRNTKWMDKGF